VASLSQGRTAAAQCGLFTYKSVPVIFEPPCTYIFTHTWILFTISDYMHNKEVVTWEAFIRIRNSWFWLSPQTNTILKVVFYSDDSLEYNAGTLPQMTATFLRILFSWWFIGINSFDLIFIQVYFVA